jgi:hypothetical protein
MERLSGNSRSKRTPDLLGTVTLCGVLVVVGVLLVAAFVWVVPLAMRLLLRS